MTNKHQILVVDDDPDLRACLSSELRSEGYDVFSVMGGEEAISIIQKRPFDLVLLDIRMPGVDGFKVLKFIKKNYPTDRVIMLTAFADIINEIESRIQGAEAFVKKPYDVADLLATIDRVIHQ